MYINNIMYNKITNSCGYLKYWTCSLPALVSTIGDTELYPMNFPAESHECEEWELDFLKTMGLSIINNFFCQFWHSQYKIIFCLNIGETFYWYYCLWMTVRLKFGSYRNLFFLSNQEDTIECILSSRIFMT